MFSKRSDALAAKAKEYFTGAPCKHGHVSVRIAATGECRQCSRAKYKKYRLVNADRLVALRKGWKKPNRKTDKNREWSRKYYQKNKFKHLLLTKAYREKNLHKYAAYKRKRDAKKRLTNGGHHAHDVTEIRKMQKGKCGYCRVPLASVRVHLDHIMPIAKGGADVRGNLQLLCSACNQRKSSRDPIDFARTLGALL